MNRTFVSGLKRAVTVCAGVSAIAMASSGHAAVLLTEGFDDISTLSGGGWVLQNLSVPPGSTGWFQGDPTVFASHAGAPDSYIAANFNNSTIPGMISNWLMTPELALAGPTTLSAQLRVNGDSFLDTIEIYYSTEGASSDVADFTLLGSYSSSIDQGWVPVTFNVASGTSGRFAFRYFVADTTNDGNYIGIDTVSVTSADVEPVPEPATYALLLGGLGLLGFMARRRRA